MTNRRVIAHTECSLGWGGQEIRIFTEMRAMRERGHSLSLHAPPQAVIFQKCQADGFPVFPIDDARWKYPLTILRLARFWRRSGAQVVNMHSSRDGWLGGIAARLAGVPLIIRSRHIEVDYPNRRTSRLAFHSLPHHVLTTSDKISERLIRELNLNPNRVSCLPTGIDLKRYDSRLPGKLHEELHLPPDLPLVGMITVLRSWKGHPYFLEAAQTLIGANRRAHFIIVGDGPGRDGLHQQTRDMGLEKQVTFLGHRDDVPNILASLAILVLPSTAHEGVPQIILQAQAMGRPVVGTTVGGIPQVVTDGETGWLVPPKDSKALAEKIGALLDAPDLRQKIGQQARDKAIQNYSVERMCEKLEAIYDRYL